MKRILLPLMLLLTITAYGQQRLRVSAELAKKKPKIEKTDNAYKHH